MSVSVYDPRISTLVANTEVDWGDPAHNRENLVFYQTAPEFDSALYGVDLVRGELITIQAPKKQRKSTMLANWWLHFLIQLKKRKLWISIDTLESGMTPEAYRDTLIAMLATRHLIGSTLNTMKRELWPSVDEIFNNPNIAPHLGISQKFLRYGRRTEKQQESIDWARNFLGQMNLTIFGPSKAAGQTRNLSLATRRWEQLHLGEYPGLEGCVHVMFAVDNVQQYNEYAGNSYNGLELVTNSISDFASSYAGIVFFAVSQVSLGSQRRANDLGESMDARGGSRLAEEAVAVFQPEYDKDERPRQLIIRTPYSRNEPPPPIIQDIDPSSGTFLAPGKVYIR